MDSIAFAFCDAVVGTIKDLPRVDVPFRDAKWNKALQDHSANRTCFLLYVGYYHGDDKWYYCLYNTEFNPNTPFATILKRVGSKHLRIDRIEIVAWWTGIVTSKAELHVLPNSLQPFLNFPILYLNDVAAKVPESDFDQLLSSFAKVNISLFFSSSSGRSAIEFAKHLMQQDTLVNAIVIQREQDLLADAVADYRATGKVVHVETKSFSVRETFLCFVR